MCCGFYLLGDVQVAGVRLISRVFGYCALLPVETKFVCGCLILARKLRRDCWWSCSCLELRGVEVSVGRFGWLQKRRSGNCTRGYRKLREECKD